MQQRPMTTYEIELAARDGRPIALDYSYLPRRRPWDPARSKIFQLIDRGSQRYVEFLERVAIFAPEFERIQLRSKLPNDLAPQWVNGWFPGMESITLYGMLALNNPQLYVEGGSGNSTMFARQAIKDHKLRTEIVSIDPIPHADIDLICDDVIRQRCEDVKPELFLTPSLRKTSCSSTTATDRFRTRTSRCSSPRYCPICHRESSMDSMTYSSHGTTLKNGEADAITSISA